MKTWLQKVGVRLESNGNLGVCVVFVVFFMLIHTFRELIKGELAFASLLSRSSVIAFLFLSYLFERKLHLKRSLQGVLYSCLLFAVGTWMSAVPYHNQLNLRLVVLYFCLAVLGSMIWVALLTHAEARRNR